MIADTSQSRNSLLTVGQLEAFLLRNPHLGILMIRPEDGVEGRVVAAAVGEKAKRLQAVIEKEFPELTRHEPEDPAHQDPMLKGEG